MFLAGRITPAQYHAISEEYGDLAGYGLGVVALDPIEARSAQPATGEIWVHHERQSLLRSLPRTTLSNPFGVG